ncbi:Crp/Fnr family transcriptional regulator [Algoriphagus namhaensis]
MRKFEEIVGSFPNVSVQAIEAFKGKFEKTEHQRGDLLEQQGLISNYLYFIEEGAARSFYLREKRDITVSFSLEGEFLTSMYSFVTRKPSYEFIECIEKCQCLRIKHEDLQEMFLSYPEIEHAYRLILERYYIALEEQLIFSKFKSAKERYLELIENRPKIIQKASVGQIASYLDMSIETLSRVRSRI